MILVVVLLLVLGLFWVSYFLMPPVQGLPILMYHKVSEDRNDKLTISVDRLSEQFACIQRLGYQPISFADLRESLTSRHPLPEKPILLTFDDGYQSVYELAYPLLRRFDFRATVLLPTKYVGKANEWDGGSERIMSYETISEMRNLIEVGLHSHQHESYREYSPAQMEDDIGEGMRRLEQARCQVAPVFAYPYGRMPANRQGRNALRQTLRKHGIAFAVRIGSRVNMFPFRDVYALTRIGINGTDSPRQFKTKLKKGRTRPF